MRKYDSFITGGVCRCLIGLKSRRKPARHCAVQDGGMLAGTEVWNPAEVVGSTLTLFSWG